MTRVLGVSIAVEGDSDVPVVSRILRDHDLAVNFVYGRRGKHHLDAKLSAFNKAAKFGNWLVVRDLDHDAECAAALVKMRLPRPSAGMRYRIAVRALEAWLLADAEGVAKFLAVARHHVPTDPETLNDPKAAFVDVARKSRSRAIREDMVPAFGTSAKVGPAHVARIGEFAESSWSWKRGSQHSESLSRCVARIAEWR